MLRISGLKLTVTRPNTLSSTQSGNYNAPGKPGRRSTKMKEKSPASQSRQSTKGGSLPPRRGPSPFWQRALPFRRGRLGSRSENEEPRSQYKAETPDSNLSMVLRQVVYELFCSERGLNRNPDLCPAGRVPSCVFLESRQWFRGAGRRKGARHKPRPTGFEWDSAQSSPSAVETNSRPGDLGLHGVDLAASDAAPDVAG